MLKNLYEVFQTVLWDGMTVQSLEISWIMVLINILQKSLDEQASFKLQMNREFPLELLIECVSLCIPRKWGQEFVVQVNFFGE